MPNIYISLKLHYSTSLKLEFRRITSNFLVASFLTSVKLEFWFNFFFPSCCNKSGNLRLMMTQTYPFLVQLWNLQMIVGIHLNSYNVYLQLDM